MTEEADGESSPGGEWSSLSLGGQPNPKPDGDGSEDGSVGKGDAKDSQLPAVRLRQQVFVDSDADANALFSFREVLLKSAALELLAISMLHAPAIDEAERELNLELFGYCLVGGAAAAKRLLTSLAEVMITLLSQCTSICPAPSSQTIDTMQLRLKPSSSV
jgi:hypothetical protein